jgi:leucyl aminopeptidase
VNPLLLDASETAIPIHVVSAVDWPTFRDKLPRIARAFMDANSFEPSATRHILLPGVRVI